MSDWRRFSSRSVPYWEESILLLSELYIVHATFNSLEKTHLLINKCCRIRGKLTKEVTRLFASIMENVRPGSKFTVAAHVTQFVLWHDESDSPLSLSSTRFVVSFMKTSSSRNHKNRWWKMFLQVKGVGLNRYGNHVSFYCLWFISEPSWTQSRNPLVIEFSFRLHDCELTTVEVISQWFGLNGDFTFILDSRLSSRTCANANRCQSPLDVL